MDFAEPAPAKLNLALHVRGKLPDGRHRIETIFAFCTDGDRVAANAADHLSLQSVGPFASEIGAPEDNLVPEGCPGAPRSGGSEPRRGAHADEEFACRCGTWRRFRRRRGNATPPDAAVGYRPRSFQRRRAQVGIGRPRVPSQHDGEGRRRGGRTPARRCGRQRQTGPAHKPASRTLDS